jgi:hypothetical protein
MPYHTGVLQHMLADGLKWAVTYGVRTTTLRNNKLPDSEQELQRALLVLINDFAALDTRIFMLIDEIQRLFLADHEPGPLGIRSVSRFFKMLVSPSVQRGGHVHFVMTGSCTCRAWLSFRKASPRCAAHSLQAARQTLVIPANDRWDSDDVADVTRHLLRM